LKLFLRDNRRAKIRSPDLAKPVVHAPLPQLPGHTIELPAPRLSLKHLPAQQCRDVFATHYHWHRQLSHPCETANLLWPQFTVQSTLQLVLDFKASRASGRACSHECAKIIFMPARR
jgi:hypothetical protein